MTLDGELLRRYTEAESDDAFAELVRRHLDLVYSAALRQVNGDAHLAQDVAQTVFTDLAHKAAALSHRQVLTGWLYTSTHFAAAKAVRTEHRRHTHEQEAHAMQELLRSPASDFDWEQLRPVLDQVMHDLKASDRDVILMRYFENRPLADIGERLGLSEDAARKRVDRALGKLRTFLSKRGITTAATLATVLSANAVQIAPAGLAATLTSASLAGAAAGTGTTLSLLKFMATTKLKAGLVGAAVLVATTTSLVQHRSLRQLESENTALREQTAHRLNEQNARLQKLKIDEDELERLRGEHSELMRLRGEVTGLRRETVKVGSLESELAKLRSANEQVPPGASKLIIHNPYLAREAWSDKGTDSPYHAFETLLWAGITGDTQRLAEVTIPGENSLLLKDRPPLAKIKGVQIVSVDGNPNELTRVGAIVEDEFYGGGLDKPPGTVQGIRFWYLIQTNGEWKVTGQKVSW
jgi:RNA polymerase sigma factor (sigma-70 family)